MDLFKVTNFEINNVADAACKELFTKSSNKKNKNKPTISGKVKKKKRSKADKRKMTNIVHLNPETIETNIIKKHPNSIKNKEKTIKENLKKKNKQFQKASPMKNPEHSTEKFNKKSTTEKNKTKNQKHKKDSKEITEPQKRKKKPKTKNFETSLAPPDIEQNLNEAPSINENSTGKLDYKQKKQEKLKEKIQKTINQQISSSQEKQPIKSLRTRMMERLQSARFRYLNEQIYSSDSKEAQKFFSNDPDSFHAYHEGYRQQVNKWPLNPVDVIVTSVQKLPKTHIIADFGCGDAKLAKSVSHKVHSFDLVATNELVTPCNMAHVPLQNNSVDVAIFCLSLMGTNLRDYFLEANRVLKVGGILKIAEVESRFDDVNQFIEGVQRFHFKNTWKDLSHNLFYFLDFKKESHITNKKKLPTISLHPCLYKKR